MSPDPVKQVLGRLIRALASPAILLLPALASGAAEAQTRFARADIFFELNASAGDLGVHVDLDAESWKQLLIEDPRGRRVIEVRPLGNAARIGLTELFFEGEEPSLEEVPFRQFLNLFPEGRYVFTGRTIGNQLLRSTDPLTAALPCPVRLDAPETDGNVSLDRLRVDWTAPPGTYDPDRKVCSARDPVSLTGFQVIVEFIKEERDFLREYSVILSSGTREALVPPQFLREGLRFPDTTLLIEVLALERSGNKTITEQTWTCNGGTCRPDPAA